MAAGVYRGLTRATGHKVGFVNDLGAVYTGLTHHDGRKIGFVRGDGAVYTGITQYDGKKVGFVTSQGRVYLGLDSTTGRQVAYIGDTGGVYVGPSADLGTKIGVVDTTVSRQLQGGAALLLLVPGSRPDPVHGWSPARWLSAPVAAPRGSWSVHLPSRRMLGCALLLPLFALPLLFVLSEAGPPGMRDAAATAGAVILWPLLYVIALWWCWIPVALVLALVVALARRRHR